MLKQGMPLWLAPARFARRLGVRACTARASTPLGAHPVLTTDNAGIREVIHVRSVEEVGPAVDALLADLRAGPPVYPGAPLVLGFDTETGFPTVARPKPPVALLQLASERVAALFHVATWGHCRGLYFPNALQDVLCDPGVLKVGQVACEEAVHLRQQLRLPTILGVGSTDILAERIMSVEAGTLPLGFKRTLAALVNRHLQFTLLKPRNVQVSDWTARALSRRQVEYAALDAWASRAVFLKLADRYCEVMGTDLPTLGLPNVLAASKRNRPPDVVECPVSCHHDVPIDIASTALYVYLTKHAIHPPVYNVVRHDVDGFVLSATVTMPDGQVVTVANSAPHAKKATARSYLAMVVGSAAAPTTRTHRDTQCSQGGVAAPTDRQARPAGVAVQTVHSPGRDEDIVD